MKNFRKTIIALATVAAMLVPSAAMAATLTTTVDKDITGDVYVGFYDGAILKDVVKTTVDDITVSEAETASTEELPVTVTITEEEYKVRTSDGAQLYKLVFTAKGDATIDRVNMTMSWDNTVIQPVASNAAAADLAIGSWATGNSASPHSRMTYYDDDEGEDVNFDRLSPKTGTFGTRDAATFGSMKNGAKVSIADGCTILEFYYRVLDGKAVTTGTFNIETEIGTGSIHSQLKSDPGKEVGIKIADTQNAFTYGCWLSGVATPDTIKLVTPWDAPVVPEVTTKDLTVEVPAGAEAYTATMFIWDADQNAVCDPITAWN